MAYRQKTAEQQFEEQVQGENCLPAEEDVQAFCAEEGEEIDRFLGRTNDDPFAGCDPRDARVEDTERDAKLRHRDYTEKTDRHIIPLIHRSPEVFTVLRDSIDAGEIAYQWSRVIENPELLNRPEFRGFEDYLRDVASRKTGKFTNLTPAEFERALKDFKEHADEGETIEEFFSKR